MILTTHHHPKQHHTTPHHATLRVHLTISEPRLALFQKRHRSIADTTHMCQPLAFLQRARPKVCISPRAASNHLPEQSSCAFGIVFCNIGCAQGCRHGSPAHTYIHFTPAVNRRPFLPPPPLQVHKACVSLNIASIYSLIALSGDSSIPLDDGREMKPIRIS